jgi:hypothetical protein
VAKTWTEKLNGGKPPHIETIDKPVMGMKPGCRMLVSNPLEVKQMMDSIPKGVSMTQAELRQKLAEKHGADTACPISTGIFVRIASEVALEQMQAGAAEVTPFWRVVDPKSPLAKKLSCGPERVKSLRDQEGL